jgi:5'-nucleotidase
MIPLRLALVGAFGLSAFAIAGVLAACGSNSSADEQAANVGEGSNVQVQILAVNDFHGNLQPPTGSSGMVTAKLDDPIAQAPDAGIVPSPDAGTALVPAGGAAFLATHVKDLRAKNPYTVLVSAGDLTGASPLLSNLFKDEPSVLVMNQIGLDYEGVGNHDFDRGLAELLRLQKGGCSLGDCDAGAGHFGGAKYEYLAANVEDTETKQTVFPPFALKEIGGVKVAFVGMTLEATPSVTVASAVQGLEFENEVTTVNALVPELKKAGASAIVVLLHQGGLQAPTGTYDSCSALTGDLLPLLAGNPEAGKPALDPAVDVVVSAHTHQAYNCTVDGRLVTSAASFGRVVTKIDLTIDKKAGKVVAKQAKNIAVTRDVTPDPDVAGILAEYETKAAPLANRVVGHITGDITASAKTAGSVSCETPLGDLIADAQLAATKDAAAGGAVLAFMNPGGIRTDLVAKAPNKTDGTITFAEAFAVQPFSNNLVTMTLTGVEIQTLLDQQFVNTTPRMLQVSSNFSYSYTYDAATQRGTVDASSIKIGGEPVDPQRTYRVTVNAFLAGGGDGFAVLKSGTDRLSGEVDLDALVAYLGANSSESAPLQPPTSNRYTGNACPLQ